MDKTGLRRLSSIIALLICLAGSNFAMAASRDFLVLKSMLKSRESEPRIYLPSSVVLGNTLEVLVVAPGAESITLLASNNNGHSMYHSKNLNLGAGYFEVGTKQGSKAKFQLDVDMEKYLDMQEKFLYFEALANYKTELGEDKQQIALYYGSTATYSNFNGVKISPVPKSNTAAAALAKSFIPGLTAGSRQPRY